MERKTTVEAENGKQHISITREFDLPLELLFRAYTEADIVEQWMGTKVLKLESKNHGGWRFETSDGNGNVVVSLSGVIHEIIPQRKITRTFEMENADFGVQLEFHEFASISSDTSRLKINIIFQSGEHRDRMLRLPFSYGLNMAHNRLQNIAAKYK